MFISFFKLCDVIKKRKVDKDDENKDLLLSFFKKHEHLFCDKNEVRRKKLVPIEYNKRIFRGI